MLWSDRRSFLLAPLALAACGFEPVYAPGATGSRLQGNIAFDDPATRESFLLVQELERRLGRGTAPEYRLEMSLNVSTSGIGIDAEGNTTREQYVGDVSYVLRELTSGRAAHEGSHQAFTGYSTTGSNVATSAAQRDANRRLMVIIADRIVQDLLTADLPA